MRQAVVERLQSAMRDAGLDAVVAASPENYAYVAGFVVPSHPLMRWRHALTVVTADGRAALLTVDMEETTVRQQSRRGDGYPRVGRVHRQPDAGARRPAHRSRLD